MTESEVYQTLPTSIVRILNNYNLSYDNKYSWDQQEENVFNELNKGNFKTYYTQIDNILSQGTSNGKIVLSSTYLQNVSNLLKLFEKQKIKNLSQKLTTIKIEPNIVNQILGQLSIRSSVVIPYQWIEKYSLSTVKQMLEKQIDYRIDLNVVNHTAYEGSTNRIKVKIGNKTEWVYLPILPLALVKRV